MALRYSITLLVALAGIYLPANAIQISNNLAPCLKRDVSDRVQEADIVFSAEITVFFKDVQGELKFDPDRSHDDITPAQAGHRYETIHAWKGNPGKSGVIYSNCRFPSSVKVDEYPDEFGIICLPRYRPGETYMFFANVENGRTRIAAGKACATREYDRALTEKFYLGEPDRWYRPDEFESVTIPDLIEILMHPRAPSHFELPDYMEATEILLGSGHTNLLLAWARNFRDWSCETEGRHLEMLSYILRRLGPDAESLIPLITDLRHCESPTIRHLWAMMHGAIADGPEFVELVKLLLQDSIPEIRYTHANRAAREGGTAKTLVKESLMETFFEEVSDARYLAASKLSHHDTLDTEVINRICGMDTEEDSRHDFTWLIFTCGRAVANNTDTAMTARIGEYLERNTEGDIVNWRESLAAYRAAIDKPESNR